MFADKNVAGRPLLKPEALPEEGGDRLVGGMLRFVGDFGVTAERFFERIYRGLNRKRHAGSQLPTPPDNEQLAALRRANRELSARIREVQTVASRMEAVFARIGEGVIMQSPEGRIVLMNDAALRLVGTVKAFWDSELGQMFRAAQRASPGGGEIAPVGTPVRAQVNGLILGAQLAAVFNTEGEALGTLIVLRDVTHEALADRLKEQFVTQITHELRTPLTAIKGMSEILLNQPENKPPNRKFLEAIARNAAIVDKMIVELLDLSEITAGSFTVRKHEVALDELVLDAIKAREAQIKKADLRVGMMVVNPSRVRIAGDPRRLSWAIGHVLDNSLNYTLKGGMITLRVGGGKNELALVEVIDSGVGISERDMPHIFERFYRGEAKTQEGKTIDPRGLGQGLFIARTVAEAHQGFLVAQSQIGKGSRFVMGLPLIRTI